MTSWEIAAGGTLPAIWKYYENASAPSSIAKSRWLWLLASKPAYGSTFWVQKSGLTAPDPEQCAATFDALFEAVPELRD